ncbi:MAG TPA: sensor histidine kinase [Thermoanaerobaculia bacterium]
MRTDAEAAGQPRQETEDPGDATQVGLPDPMVEIVGRVRRITSENERLFQRLIEGERRFRGLAKAVWKVQEDERRRLARELHDGLGQTLTALTNQLERLQRKAGDDGELAAGLADAVETARATLNEIREMSRLLRPPVLDDLGLPAALSWLTRTLEQRTGLRAELALEGLHQRLDTDLETLVFRLVQEGLTNVLRHAGVDRAEVGVSRIGTLLELRVADAGRGFDPRAVLDGGEAATGAGLRGMRDRLELFGGRLEVVSSPGRGTLLSAEVPLVETP